MCTAVDYHVGVDIDVDVGDDAVDADVGVYVGVGDEAVDAVADADAVF